MESQGIDVELGMSPEDDVTHVYRMKPQRQARLFRRLFGEDGAFVSMEAIQDDLQVEASMDNLFNLIGGKLYDVLLVFIPELMPRWEFDGYGSEGHAERNEYVEEMDRSPTHPQVKEALRTAVQVNGLAWVKKVTSFFDQRMVKAELNLIVMQLLQQVKGQVSPSTGTTTSPSLQPGNGASAPTSSGTSEPTPPSEPSEETASASPSPASSD